MFQEGQIIHSCLARIVSQLVPSYDTLGGNIETNVSQTRQNVQNLKASYLMPFYDFLSWRTT